MAHFQAPQWLLTNDDGAEAPGLAALARACSGLARCVVAAPAIAWSCRGHSITTDAAFRLQPLGPDRFAIHASPADCVRIGLHTLAPGVDWVIAGINEGANLGADIHSSGTVAAAREAALHGRSAVAISHYLVRGRPVDWERAARWAARVLDLITRLPAEPVVLWNVNLPCPPADAPPEDPEIVVCPVDPSPLPLGYEVEGDLARYRGSYHERKRRPGGDVDVCFGGRISVSRLTLVPPWHEPGSLVRPGPGGP
ncbi:MAG: 5'/3'-nucleotidase SurE [Isosphaeraceae bacterium]